MDKALINIIALTVPVFFCAVFLSGTYHRLKSLRARIPFAEVADAVERYQAAFRLAAGTGLASGEALAKLLAALDSGEAAVERFRRDRSLPDAAEALDRAMKELETAAAELVGGLPEDVAAGQRRVTEAVCSYNEHVSAYEVVRREVAGRVVGPLFGFGKRAQLEACSGRVAS